MPLIHAAFSIAPPTVFPLNATRKAPDVQARLDKPHRSKRDFTPTGAAWLNLVERFFAKITVGRIRRGSYSSVDALRPQGIVSLNSR